MTNEQKTKLAEKISDKIGFELPIDIWLSSFTKRPIINGMAMDKILREKFDDYSNDKFVHRGEANERILAYIRAKFGRKVSNDLKMLF